VSLALQQRAELGLSADQATTLESIRSEFQKMATRQSAEIQVAELELGDLLRAGPVDLAKVEATLRQIERLRTDLRLARRGFEEMQRFMQSEQMPQAMAGMMEMARRVGNGDPMAGMVRMMEMMGAMGGDGGGMMSGFRGYPAPEESR
jgi:hypothetical protein